MLKKQSALIGTESIDERVGRREVFRKRFEMAHVLGQVSGANVETESSRSGELDLVDHSNRLRVGPACRPSRLETTTGFEFIGDLGNAKLLGIAMVEDIIGVKHTCTCGEGCIAALNIDEMLAPLSIRHGGHLGCVLGYLTREERRVLGIEFDQLFTVA